MSETTWNERGRQILQDSLLEQLTVAGIPVQSVSVEVEGCGYTAKVANKDLLTEMEEAMIGALLWEYGFAAANS